MRLEVADLGYRIAERSILASCSLQVGKGESLAVVGPSGSGKSTLLGVISGLLTPDSGRVLVDGEDIVGWSVGRRDRYRLHQVGFVLQFGELLPELTVLENVELPLRLQGKRHSAKRALEMLDAVGIAAFADRMIDQISGGERQRVAVARSLVHEPLVVLADEPTGSLDDTNRSVVTDLLLERSVAQGAALVLVTHDDATAQRCDRMVTLHNGALVPAVR